MGSRKKQASPGEVKKGGLEWGGSEFLVLFGGFVGVQAVFYYSLQVPFLYRQVGWLAFAAALLGPGLLLGLGGTLFLGAAGVRLPYSRGFYNGIEEYRPH
jgi:hypothetical protein